MVHNEEMRVVAEIFRMASEGLGPNAIEHTKALAQFELANLSERRHRAEYRISVTGGETLDVLLRK